jgi:hypothetical protein
MKGKMMSNTPRTDVKERETVGCVMESHAHYGWKFARALETELAAATARIAEIERDAQWARDMQALLKEPNIYPLVKDFKKMIDGLLSNIDTAMEKNL